MKWLLDRFAQAPAELTAFVHKGRPHSYPEFSRSITHFAEQLQARGVKPGQTVLVVADYAPDVVAMILALASLACGAPNEIRPVPDFAASISGWTA